MHRPVQFAIPAFLALAACAFPPEYKPVVDMTGHTQAQYDYDLTLCRENAKQLYILPGVAIGVVAGAATGAGVGAVTSDAGSGAATGVGIGAVSGGAAGSLYPTAKTATTGVDPLAGQIRQCLEQHGYTLLDPSPVAETNAAQAPKSAPTPSAAPPQAP